TQGSYNSKREVLAYFSRKLSTAQHKYSITELELLSIVECLKEFKGMLWGQSLQVYTDHKNLVRDALGMTSDRVYRWRLILEEYGPKIIYIKGVDNIVANAMSCLEYYPEKNVKNLHVSQRMSIVAKLLRSCSESEPGGVKSKYANSHKKLAPQINLKVNDIVNNVFANISEEEDDIYPPTIAEIARAHRKDRKYKMYFRSVLDPKRDKKITVKVMDTVEVLVFDKKRLVIPGRK
ncbi:MAG: hypothetical protein GY874_11510, partial [Desulfobacteraceae bacterium]|nr:hypothetical protein [Desulfobacteraceae bacterium]